VLEPERQLTVAQVQRPGCGHGVGQCHPSGRVAIPAELDRHGVQPDLVAGSVG
jgi:hypothetical protein